MEENNQSQSENKINLVQRIKDTVTAKTVDYKYKKLNELTLKQKYLITNIVKISTKYGDKLVAHLEYKGFKITHKFRTYLPDRFNRISDEDIEELSSGEFYLLYQGKNEKGHHIIDFE